MPISLQVRITRNAISPLLAIKIFLNIHQFENLKISKCENCQYAIKSLPLEPGKNPLGLFRCEVDKILPSTLLSPAISQSKACNRGSSLAYSLNISQY